VIDEHTHTPPVGAVVKMLYRNWIDDKNDTAAVAVTPLALYNFNGYHLCPPIQPRTGDCVGCTSYTHLRDGIVPLFHL